MPTIEARVIDVHRGRYDAETQTGVLACRLRGRLGKAVSGQRSLVVVGDLVTVTPGDDGDGVIEAILPRQTMVSRRAR